MTDVDFFTPGARLALLPMGLQATEVTGHETEMAAVSEFDRPPQTVAEMENRLRLMFAAMPAGDPPAENLFGEPYGEEGQRRDMALYLERLASMASAFAKRLEADHEIES